MTDLDPLTAHIQALKPAGRRALVAVTGPPGSGKSTVAHRLVQALGVPAVLVPMDGFHLDDRLLGARGLLPRKGAPETFDAAGFVNLVRRLAEEAEIVFPLFDRSREIAIAGAGLVGPETEIVVLEGNYLLLDAPPWSKLHQFWDLSVALDVPLDELRQRLIQRRREHGHTAAEAKAQAETNDLPNADTVLQNSIPADVTLANS